MGNKASSSSEEQVEEPPAPSQEQQMSYYQMAKAGYQQLVHAIIRPPRCDYDESILGPKEFTFCGKNFRRTDFVIKNARKLNVHCSMWEPVKADRPNPVLPCVIYMHGNSSGRPEALTIISLVLSIGATLMCFDFCGSGMSDGEYVSLGVYEKDDLAAVIEHLRLTGTTSTIALWGRSMGAASALLHGERDPSIAGMVLDSAYSDLTALAEEMVEKGRQQGMFAPGILVRLVLSFIKSSIQKSANFDIRDVSPIRGASKSYIPALFVAARGDDFVAPHHSKNICDSYAGDKNLILVEGDHNSNRPFFLYTSAAIFLQNTLQVPDAWSLPDSQKYIGGLKPWDFVGSGGGRSAGGGMFHGFDDDDAALERILAISLLEQSALNSGRTQEPLNTATAPGSESAARRRERDEPDGVSETRTNEAVLSTTADISSASGGAVDIGMTGERQQHLRNAIYNMFNGTASAPTTAFTNPGVSGTAPKDSTGRPIKSTDAAGKGAAKYKESAPESAPAPAVSAADATATVEAAGTAGEVTTVPTEVTARDIVHEAGDEENSLGIPCPACTLLNAPTLRFCAACNHTLPVPR